MIHKILPVAVLAIFSISKLSAQTIVSYGPYKVDKDELWKAFSKNNSDKNATTLQEYVTLYTNFKLKVQAAKDLKMDTLHQIKEDVAGFRNQIMDSYLADETGVKNLQNEAFERSQKDLRVMHYFLTFATADSAEAEKNINVIYNQLAKGIREDAITNTNFKGEDLGYVTVFSVPYFYENIIYALKPGEYSRPVKRGNTWHIFKVTEKREAAGTWKAAQILFAFPEGATAIEKDRIHQKADSVYTLLQNGLDFGTAASEYSNDRMTNHTQGVLPEFGAGKYNPGFEENVFALKNDGDFTKPFLTSFGYHIVRRISVKPIPASDKDAEYEYEIKQKIMADERMQLQKAKYENEIIKQTGFKKLPAFTANALYAYTTPAAPKTSKPYAQVIIGQFADGTKLSLQNWVNYIADNTENTATLSHEELWDKYLHYVSVKHFKDNIERYNQDFAGQVKEFKEGNLLFEIMDKKVWGKAAANEKELKNYYAAHKQKYTWAPSADAIVFNCVDKATADKVLALSKAGEDWRKIVLQNEGKAFADSGRYELDQLIEKQYAPDPKPESFSTIVVSADNAASFVHYKTIYPAGGVRNFSDARGLVINDYQDVLETQWLNELKKKYPVVVNTELVRKMQK